jgi:HEAT repeat protein
LRFNQLISWAFKREEARMNFVAVLLVLLAQDPEFDRLLKDLDHEEIERREGATEGLRRLKPESLEIDRQLEAFVRETKGEAAKRAEQVRRIRIAARLLPDPDRVIERLASTDVNIRRAAIQALAQKGGAGAPLVRGLLQDSAVQVDVLRILIAADSGDYLGDIRTFAEHPSLFQLALPWLAARGDLAAAGPLRAQMDRNNTTWALEHLARLRQSEDIPRLRALLVDNPWSAGNVFRNVRGWDEAKRELAREIRQHAIEGVGEAILLSSEVRDAEFVAALKSLLPRENPAAAFVLGAMGDRDAIPFLMRLVRQRSFPAAVAMLGRLRAREGVWLFRKLLSEPKPPEPRDRAAFARAMGEIGGPEAEDALLGLMQDASEEVRFDAAVSLGRLKCGRALQPLIVALDDAVAFSRGVPPTNDFDLVDWKVGAAEWRQVREAASESLAAISGEKPAGTLDERVAAWRTWWARREPRR